MEYFVVSLRVRLPKVIVVRYVIGDIRHPLIAEADPENDKRTFQHGSKVVLLFKTEV